MNGLRRRQPGASAPSTEPHVDRAGAGNLRPPAGGRPAGTAAAAVGPSGGPPLLMMKAAPPAAEDPFALHLPQPTLQVGAAGPAVTRLQQALVDHGAALVADGRFGPQTRAAVVAFQLRQGLTPDGIVGPMTWGALGGRPATAAPPTPTTAAPPAPATAAPPAARTDTPTGAREAPEPGATTTIEPQPRPGTSTVGANASLDARGLAALEKVKASGHKRSGGLLRGEGKGIDGFPPWFVELQDLLSVSIEWKAEEVEAQEVLHDYATWYAQQRHGGAMPASLEVFFRYLGSGQRNVADATAGGHRTAAAMGGVTGGSNWCQWATSKAAEIALAERGLKFKHGAHAWLNNAAKRKQGAGAAYAATAYAAELRPGDYVSYFYQGCQAGGHAVTVVEDLGASFLHVSGNTGGVGAVRLQESPRMTSPPPGFDQNKAMASSEHCRSLSFGDAVLVWSITRAGDIWSELAQLDAQHPAADPAAYQALLDRLELAPRA